MRLQYHGQKERNGGKSVIFIRLFTDHDCHWLIYNGGVITLTEKVLAALYSL